MRWKDEHEEGKREGGRVGVGLTESKIMKGGELMHRVWWGDSDKTIEGKRKKGREFFDL